MQSLCLLKLKVFIFCTVFSWFKDLFQRFSFFLNLFYFSHYFKLRKQFLAASFIRYQIKPSS